MSYLSNFLSIMPVQWLLILNKAKEYNLIVSETIFFTYFYFEKQMQCFIQALDSCACKAYFGLSCHGKKRLGRHWWKLKCACTLLGLKNMKAYESKICDLGTSYGYFELKMLCLFYFVLESEKTGIIARLQWYLRNKSFLHFYILSFLFQFLMSIDSWVNSSLSTIY